MRRSIATVSLSGTLEEKLAVAAQVGFDGVEIFEADLITCASTPAQVRERAQDLGLQLELYQPFRDFEAVPPELLARNLRRAELKFRLTRELGIDTVLVCSSVSPSARDDDGPAWNSCPSSRNWPPATVSGSPMRHWPGPGGH